MPISLSGSLNLSGSLTTTGTITATTLVVQTITSSISSITGSTNFGSLAANTHTFTGSVGISGSLSGSGATFSGVVISNNSFYTAVTSDTLGVRSFGGSSYSLRNSTNEDFNIDVFNRTTSTWYNAFKITNDGGAATFSSSVAINGGDFRYRPNGDVTNSPALVFKDAGNSALDICAEVIGDANAASRPITFRVSSVANGRYEAMRITSAGNVGIRTTSPQASLHIAGLADQNALTIGASNAYEIFITGSDSANIYHASPNQAIYLNTNGGPLYLGTSNASTLLTVTGSNVGIGTTTPTTSLAIKPANSSTNAFSIIDPSSTQRIASISFSNATNAGELSLDSNGTTYVRISANRDSYITGGNLGIGTSSTLATLSTIGGAVQFMGDYRNHQTIIKNAGANGTFSGALTITIPQMSDGNVDGYGAYSCEVYVSGYSGMYCHVWFSGYINGGITPGEATILRSNGGWSISQASYGANNQGFTFTIDYPSGIIHPAARIIFNKGGSVNSAQYPANTITAVFS